MKIITFEETRLNEVAQYISRVSGEDFNKVFEKYEKKIKRETDEVLVCIENNKIIGVVAICIDVEGKYVELTAGVYTDDDFEKVSMFFYGYLKDKFSGYQFDAVYKEENKQGTEFMNMIGAKCVFRENEMILTKEQYKPQGIKKTVVPLSDKYIKGFSMLHDKEFPDVYWTSERLMIAQDKFETFVAIDGESVIGSIVSTVIESNKKHIFFLLVDENYRKQSCARSLVEKSIETAFEKNSLVEIILCAEIDNKVSNALYQSVGFKVINKSYTYSIEQL